MNRRDLFKLAAVAGTGLVAARLPSLDENAEAVRRYWQGWSPERFAWPDIVVDNRLPDGHIVIETGWGPHPELPSYSTFGFFVSDEGSTDGEHIPLLSARYADLYAALSPADRRTFPEPVVF